MVTRLILEDFLSDTPVQPDFSQVVPNEPAGLDAYENGYKAGWDDAVQAEYNVRTRVGADLEKSLQDAVFTFAEARTDTLTALAPMLRAITENLLPEKARAEFPAMLLESVKQRVDGMQVQLIVSPENLEAVRALFDETEPPSAEISENSDLGPGQALIRAGQAEEMVDQNALLEEIRAAMEGFLTAQMQEKEAIDELKSKHVG